MIHRLSLSLVFLWASWTAIAQVVHEVTIKPLDLSESIPMEAWPASVNQLAIVDDGYYLRSGKAPMIWHVDQGGQMLRTIGGRGEGPGMLGDYGPRSFAHAKNLLLVFTPQWNRFTLFAQGEYATSFKLNRPSFRKHPLIAKGSAFDGEHILMPSYDESGLFTASVYNLEGHHQRDIGTPLPKMDNALDSFLYRNQTMWLKTHQGWCSVHIFAPQVTLYDEGFREIDRWWMQTPDLNDHYDNNLALAVQAPNRLAPLINDAQVMDGSLFFTASGKLHLFSFR